MSSTSTGGNPLDYESLSQLIYGYQPSLEAAIVFAVLFALATIVLLVRFLQRNGHTGLMVILFLTACSECVGYIFRAEFTKHDTLAVYLVQDLIILLAPNALALVTYKVLGQLIATQQTGLETLPFNHAIPIFMDKNTGLLRGNRVATVFLLSDVMSFLIQSAGGGILGSNTSDPSKTQLGEDVMLAGLAFQLFFFGLFTLLAIHAYRRRNTILQKRSYNDVEKQAQVDQLQREDLPAVLAHTYHGLFIVIVLLTIRNVFRFIEFAGGIHSYANTHEALFYVLEALPIFFAFVVFYIYDLGAVMHKFVDKPKLAELQTRKAVVGR